MVRQLINNNNRQQNRNQGNPNPALVKSSNPYIRRYILSKILDKKGNKNVKDQEQKSKKQVKDPKLKKSKSKKNEKKDKCEQKNEPKIHKINKIIQKPKKTAVLISKCLDNNKKNKKDNKKKAVSKKKNSQIKIENQIISQESKTRSGRVLKSDVSNKQKKQEQQTQKQNNKNSNSSNNKNNQNNSNQLKKQTFNRRQNVKTKQNNLNSNNNNKQKQDNYQSESDDNISVESEQEQQDYESESQQDNQIQEEIQQDNYKNKEDKNNQIQNINQNIQESSFDYDKNQQSYNIDEEEEKMMEQENEEELLNLDQDSIRKLRNYQRKNEKQQINTSNGNKGSKVFEKLKKKIVKQYSDNDSEKIITQYSKQQDSSKKRKNINIINNSNEKKNNNDQISQLSDSLDSDLNDEVIQEDIDSVKLKKNNKLNKQLEYFDNNKDNNKIEQFQTPQKKNIQPIEILDSSLQTLNSDNKTIYKKKFRSEKAKNWFTIDSPIIQSSVTMSPSNNNNKNNKFFNKNSPIHISSTKKSLEDNKINKNKINIRFNNFSDSENENEQSQQDMESETKDMQYFVDNDKIINLEKLQINKNNNNQNLQDKQKLKQQEQSLIQKYSKKNHKQFISEQIPTVELLKKKNEMYQQSKINYQQKQLVSEIQKQINAQMEYQQKISRLQKQQQVQFFSKIKKNGHVLHKNQQNQQQQLMKFIRIDIVLCVDATSTMTQYIQKCKDIIIHTFKKCLSNNINLRIGIVFYRDHPPEETSFVTRHLDLNNDIETCLQFIDNIEKGEGGGDVPEAVMDGLWDGLKLSNWRRKATKYLIHIGDAPPHGDMYTGIENFYNRSFMWKEGCPCNITIEKIAKIINQHDIRYRLVKIGSDLQRMSKIFKNNINTFKEIHVTSEKDLDKFITGMIIQENVFIEDVE